MWAGGVCGDGVGWLDCGNAASVGGTVGGAPPSVIGLDTPTTTARNVIFESYTCLRLCIYGFAFVESIHGSDFGGGFEYLVSCCDSWSFEPVLTVCGFVRLISGPVCSLYFRISMWTGGGENFHL